MASLETQRQGIAIGLGIAAFAVYLSSAALLVDQGFLGGEEFSPAEIDALFRANPGIACTVVGLVGGIFGVLASQMNSERQFWEKEGQAT